MPDGSVKHLRIVARCLMLEPGRVEFIGAVMDVTAARRAEAELQEAQAELARVTRVTLMGELAVSIAHEVNQPLAGVVTSANAGLNWLAKDPPNLLKTREAIERILRDGTRAGEVLNRIRTLLKGTPPNRSRMSVNQTIHEVVALAGGELRQNNVELSVELDSKLPAIVADSIQLQQVFLNLVINAVEAMASNANRRKILRIFSESDDLHGTPAISVKVSDTGIGLSSTDTGRLFEAFHTTKPKGMGMGLWISRSIIESHGGRLTAHSNDGPGATFQVLLPTDTEGPV
jgi:C4-dicarboxylate-specific signal transduction histidine kinase